MLFNSVDYLLFLPVVVGLYFALPARHRWALLLVASYFFYGCWKPAYLVLIVGSTLVDYLCGLRIAAAEGRGRRRAWLALSLTVNLGALFTFKYLDFFLGSFRTLSEIVGAPVEVPMAELVLPVGISFYTFQTLSYSIDVYRGKQPAERHLGRFAVFVAFFPQLVAGPIERATHLLPQFRERFRWDDARVVSGFAQLAWGLYKKVVVADRLGPLVDGVYAAPGDASGLQVLVATYAFAVQIYCDFSGYSDMAIGSARILGFELMENFRRPYAARSVGDFWRRWHISLSTWFRDYVYVPLGGGRVDAWRVRRNVMIVFVVSGLWHGANWTFVVWGFLHGAYLVLEQLLRRPLARLELGALRPLASLAAWVWTFHAVVLGWIFFRAPDVGTAWSLLARVLTPSAGWTAWTTVSGFPAVDAAVGAAAVALLFLAEWAWRRAPSVGQWFVDAGLARRVLVLYALALLIGLYGVFTREEFIYFQF